MSGARSSCSMFMVRPFWLCVAPLLARRATIDVELVAGAQHMEMDAMHGERALGASLCDVGLGDMGTVHYIDGADPDDLEHTIAYNDRGILVDADADDARILRDGAEQPPDPAAFGEMLV